LAGGADAPLAADVEPAGVEHAARINAIPATEIAVRAARRARKKDQPHLRSLPRPGLTSSFPGIGQLICARFFPRVMTVFIVVEAKR
jgi:hypothetical protein